MMQEIIGLISKIPFVDRYIMHEHDNGVLIDGFNNDCAILFRIFSIAFDYKFNEDKCIQFTRQPLHPDGWDVIECNLSDVRGELFDIKSYDNIFDFDYTLFDYRELENLLKRDECIQIDIRNGHYHSVFYSRYLQEAVLDGAIDIGLKLTKSWVPLNIHYKYGVFDVYTVVAPRICHENIFYFRV